jgi:hypothetical protein
MSAMKNSDSGTRQGSRAVTVDEMAALPAATDTATVRM